MKLKLPVLIALFFCSACSDWLELDPTDTLPTEAAFDTPRELATALTGVYHLVASVDLAGRNWLLFSDLMAQNASLNFAEFQEFTNLRISPVNSRVEGLWNTSYQAINQLNRILVGIDELGQTDGDFTVESQEQMRGEVHFLRGVIYFYLIRYFALPYSPETANEPGVPLILAPITATTEFVYPARTELATVYAQIEADWRVAEEKLSDVAASGIPPRAAATAYLAKLAFEQARWAEADEWAERVAANYQLTPTPQEFYRQEGSPEELWSAAAADENPNFAGLNWAYANAAVHTRLIENGYNALLSDRQQTAIAQAGYQTIDLRGAAGEWTADPLLSADLTTSRKYEEFGGSGDDAPLLRLAEILLLRAETAARLDRQEDAVELLNQVRRRAFRIVDATGTFVADSSPWIDYTTADFPTLESLIDAIVRERRVELAFEGHYLHDLIRLRRDVRQGVPWNSPCLRLPIPQRELDVNPNLVQNPGC